MIIVVDREVALFSTALYSRKEFDMRGMLEPPKEGEWLSKIEKEGKQLIV